MREDALVLSTASAVAVMTRSAREAAPRETGGILTGWRQGNTLVVQRALVIPDGFAGGTRYSRQHRSAEQALALHLSSMSDARLGYVGEWHTHPLPQAPSPTDWRSLREVARAAEGPVALLVAALDPDTQEVTLFGGAGSRRFGRIWTAHVEVRVLGADSADRDTDA